MFEVTKTTPSRKRYCGRVCQQRALCARGIGHSFDCQWCKKSFVPTRSDRTRYCSRTCCFQSKADTKSRRIEASRLGVFCAVWFAQCGCCTSVFYSRRQGPQFCSEACRSRDRYHKQPAPIRPERDCKECNKAFTPSHGSSLFCSKRCARRTGRRLKKPRERALHFGVHYEPVNRLKVFMRDGWTCQACNTPTPRTLMGTYQPNAPELDHIIPISRGGPHTWTNVQCLCRACNGNKGNSLPGEASQRAIAA